MIRQFSMSFAFEFSSRQRGRSTENRASGFCEFQLHPFRDIVPDSELGPMKDHCPVPNFLAYKDTTLECARRSSSLSFVPQEMSWNIDMNRILPEKSFGVSPNLLSKSLTLP